MGKGGYFRARKGDDRRTGTRVTLEYPGEFIATVETINLPDTRLSNVWGTEIYRIALKDKDARLTGSISLLLNKKTIFAY